MEKIKKQAIQIAKWDISGAERLAIWRRAQSVLKPKAGAMLKELKKIRREWQ
ncbi:MAG: hypothetical protein UY62_C0046G0010 [Parcubacteria group bacterium GW2011_GWF2_50_9]|nr:MAG: hypothetical protein UY62_C0046G0010 [Parcubacteria group bacterium GW2011_GWF2_50_9]